MAAVCCSASNAAVFLLPRPCIYLAALLAVLSHNQASRAGLLEHFVFHSSTPAAVVR